MNKEILNHQCPRCDNENFISNAIKRGMWTRSKYEYICNQCGLKIINDRIDLNDCIYEFGVGNLIVLIDLKFKETRVINFAGKNSKIITINKQLEIKDLTEDKINRYILLK